MRAFHAAATLHHALKIDHARQVASAEPLVVPRPLLTKGQKLFNKKMAKRLSKDGTRAVVEMLPDGGIHVDIKVDREKSDEKGEDGTS